MTILESVPNGIVMVNLKGEITLCNAELEKMFGYEKGELLGSEIEILVPSKYREHHPVHRGGFMASPHKRQMGAGRDLTGLRKDGVEIPVEIGLNPLRLGDQIFTLASIVDITERKKIEHKLQNAYDEVQQKNQEMEQFVYTVSHDLKAPLVTSMSFLTFLREDLAQGDMTEVLDSMNRLEKAHNKMQELIDDLLQLSRVGRMELEITDVDLNPILDEIFSGYQQKVDAKHVRIEVPRPIPLLKTDAKRIYQVFENLINNSLKYACDGPDPQIQVIWRETAKTIEIAVKDNGPGIDPLYHLKIFALFQRLTTEKEGTGVGLTIVSRIMQLHGGRAWVESSLGSGSEFWISLPKIALLKETPYGY